MQFRLQEARRLWVAFIAATGLIFSIILLSQAQEDPDSVMTPPAWSRALPAKQCPSSTIGTYCHYASPVVADMTGDGKLEIIIGTNNGNVVVYRHDGSLLWKTDIAPFFGMGGGGQVISSSPAVADIDGDGKLEIAVGTGSVTSKVCTQGGVIVLEHNGARKNGWPFLAKDQGTPPAGCRDTVFSTPALGDLDKDGKLEVVFGSFDKRIYAVHHNGQLVEGFPPSSYLFTRFGWENLQGQLADTIWSSPALADVDGDGYLDIVIGTDEGNFDVTYEPVLEPWTCPYREPSTNGYCGGSIYALDRKGQLLPGFPVYKLETIQSTPALLDVDNDGRSEIFIGTGSYYHLNSPDRPSNGFRLFGLDEQGNPLPGWSGGKATGGVVTASPSIGDITGDGKPDIVVAARDQKLYAWHANGQPVAGFPMKPQNHFAHVLDHYDKQTNFILADYTGDGRMEIFFRHAWEIIIVNGNGQQLTSRSPSESKPFYYTDGTLRNNPAVADLNGDGRLELIVSNSKLYVWGLPNSTNSADWPMFKRDAARTSAVTADLQVSPDSISLVHETGPSKTYRASLKVKFGVGVSSWSIRASIPNIVSFENTGGPPQGEKEVVVWVKVPSGAALGMRPMGDVIVEAKAGSRQLGPIRVPVNVMVLDELHRVHLPLVR